jgi:aryl-alcohol dehydrogenase-like predicted oxidoreductase
MIWRQREMGQRGMLKLWRHALDQGVRWWEVADMYGTHPLVRAALRQVERERVVITTKTLSRDADGVHADIERFRREMGVDCIDIVLLHCLTDGDWTRKMRGPMDVLSEAKAKGHIRAVGCSCHTFEALTAARDEPWVDVQLARLNRYALIMDVRKPEEVPGVVDVLNVMHDRGKGVYGMKILGEGRIQGDRINESLRFTLAQKCLDGFVIGFRSIEEFDDLVGRIESIQATA